MKKDCQKNLATVKILKKDVKTYLKLQKAGKDAKAWYQSYAVNNLLENLETTLAYVYQMKKEEFDITILFAMELINKFQSEELARVFVWRYNDFYKNSSNEEKMYRDIIESIYQYIENDPNYNRLNFTKEMKEVMCGWKGKTLQSYIENADDGYVTAVRFCIENQVFDIDNEYMAYWDSREHTTELTCFSCVERTDNQPLGSAVVRGKNRENIVGGKIVDIYIVKDVEKGKLLGLGIPYELEFETALILQTEKYCYVFWRDLIFCTIEVAACEDMEAALKTIKSVAEIQEEAQVENPYTITVERCVEKL